MKRLAFVLVLLPALSWAQKPTVIISGDGAATVVSVGTQGPAGANIPAGGSEGQGACKSGGGLGWCATFLCTGGACSFSVPILAGDGAGIGFSGEPTTKFWRNLAGAIDVDFSGVSGMRFQAGVLRLLTATGTIYAGFASDVQIGRDAASTWQVGPDAATATAQTLKGPDSTGAGNAGGNLNLVGGSPGAGGAQGNVTIGAGSSLVGSMLGPAADDCTAPPYSFTGDTTTGLCSSAASTVNVRTAGVNRVAINTTGATFTTPVLLSAGTAAAKPLAWASAPGIGLYLPNQSDLGGTLYLGDGGAALSHVTGQDGRINAAFGIGALFSNTTGYGNSAQGMNALFSNTTGYLNSAQGYLSLYSNTEGYGNSAQGAYALRLNTTGAANSVQGFFTLNSNTTGSFNSAQGFYAGYQSGASPSAANAVTTGTKLTFVGYQSGLGSSTQRTNSSAFGFEAYVDADNTVALGDENVTTVLAGSASQATVQATKVLLLPLALAALGTPANGTLAYCSDCAPQSNPCTATSTGAFAHRLNGAWDCR